MIFFVNPHLITEVGDPHTGIPIMPIMMAYAYSSAKKNNIEVQAVDCIGEDPNYMRLGKNGFSAQGLHEDIVINKPIKEPKLIAVYSRTIASFISQQILIRKLKEKFKNSKIVVIENTQAVTSYSISSTKDLLFKEGADFVLQGDPDSEISNVYRAVENEYNWREIPGLWNREFPDHEPKWNFGVKNLDELPPPDWESIRYEGYWELRYAHAPAPEPFLAVMTSRGCPYDCAFCSVPALSKRRWRYHSPEYTVNEMLSKQKKYGINDFQWEDLNPTTSNKRMDAIADIILKNNYKFNWRTASGTKIETMKEKTLVKIIKSGCKFLSFSPESGSPEHLKKRMTKPFNHEHAAHLAKVIVKHKVPVQACFVSGFPGETKEDKRLNENYIKRLSKIGVDEILVMIANPYPGSKLAKQYPDTIENRKPHELTQASRQRENFKPLIRYRNYLYFIFFLQKLIYHPTYFFKFFWNTITRKFETKANQVAYRIVWWNLVKFYSILKRRYLNETWNKIILNKSKDEMSNM